MKERLIGYTLLSLSFILFALCGATFVAMLHSLTVTSTLSAVESFFGTLVITLILLFMAKRSFNAGKNRLKSNS